MGVPVLLLEARLGGFLYAWRTREQRSGLLHYTRRPHDSAYHFLVAHYA